MKIKQRIKKVITETFDLNEISDDISQKNCAKWDSLRHLNLIVELESEFNISIEPEEIAIMKTMDDVIYIVGSKFDLGKNQL